ncbi:unnamed protein product [Allacma fusca]|uniref:Uncharacterized protein n=1 Tax=Allacma fusca TaxID=39272 RepID=A0A8J2L0E0_9HEXA|nr:unnamed protein product [Allacma fusca]
MNRPRFNHPSQLVRNPLYQQGTLPPNVSASTNTILPTKSVTWVRPLVRSEFRALAKLDSTPNANSGGNNMQHQLMRHRYGPKDLADLTSIQTEPTLSTDTTPVIGELGNSRTLVISTDLVDEIDYPFMSDGQFSWAPPKLSPTLNLNGRVMATSTKVHPDIHAALHQINGKSANSIN